MQIKDSALLRQQAHIGGEWRDADSGARIDILNPVDGDAWDIIEVKSFAPQSHSTPDLTANPSLVRNFPAQGDQTDNNF